MGRRSACKKLRSGVDEVAQKAAVIVKSALATAYTVACAEATLGSYPHAVFVTQKWEQWLLSALGEVYLRLPRAGQRSFQNGCRLAFASFPHANTPRFILTRVALLVAREANSVSAANLVVCSLLMD